MFHSKRILIVLLALVLALTVNTAIYAATAGDGGKDTPGPKINKSCGAIMNANRTQTFSMTGATYWDNNLKKFIVSPDYYHYWRDENWTEKSRSTGNSVRIDGFQLSWQSCGYYMNATLTRDGSTNYMWGDPHWNINGTHVYEVPQLTSYWFDMNNYSVRFVCNYTLWDLSVITEIEVYCPGNTRYRIDLNNNIVCYSAN